MQTNSITSRSDVYSPQAANEQPQTDSPFTTFKVPVFSDRSSSSTELKGRVSPVTYKTLTSLQLCGQKLTDISLDLELSTGDANSPVRAVIRQQPLPDPEAVRQILNPPVSESFRDPKTNELKPPTLDRSTSLWEQEQIVERYREEVAVDRRQNAEIKQAGVAFWNEPLLNEGIDTMDTPNGLMVIIDMPGIGSDNLDCVKLIVKDEYLVFVKNAPHNIRASFNQWLQPTDIPLKPGAPPRDISYSMVDWKKRFPEHTKESFANYVSEALIKVEDSALQFFLPPLPEDRKPQRFPLVLNTRASGQEEEEIALLPFEPAPAPSSNGQKKQKGCSTTCQTLTAVTVSAAAVAIAYFAHQG